MADWREETDSCPDIEVKLVVTHPYGSHSSTTMGFESTCEIKKLKEDVQHMVGIPWDQQQWTHQGRILHDSRTLMAEGVETDDIIEVAVATKPMYL